MKPLNPWNHETYETMKPMKPWNHETYETYETMKLMKPWNHETMKPMKPLKQRIYYLGLYWLAYIKLAYIGDP